jgi:hypothetical protein
MRIVWHVPPFSYMTVLLSILTIIGMLRGWKGGRDASFEEALKRRMRNDDLFRRGMEEHNTCMQRFTERNIGGTFDRSRGW